MAEIDSHHKHHRLLLSYAHISRRKNGQLSEEVKKAGIKLAEKALQIYKSDGVILPQETLELAASIVASDCFGSDIWAYPSDCMGTPCCAAHYILKIREQRGEVPAGTFSQASKGWSGCEYDAAFCTFHPDHDMYSRPDPNQCCEVNVPEEFRLSQIWAER